MQAASHDHADDHASCADTLEAALHEVGHLLPESGPIETFIHHNTLHAFEHLPFHEALAEAHRQLGVDVYLTEREYRDALATGRIDARSFEEALDASFERLPSPFRSRSEGTAFRRALLRGALEGRSATALAWTRAEGALVEECRRDVDAATLDSVAARTRVWLEHELDATAHGGSTAAFVELIVGPGLVRKFERIANVEAREQTLAHRFSVRPPARSLAPSATRSGAHASLPPALARRIAHGDTSYEALRAEQDVIADALAFSGLPTDFQSLRAAIARGDAALAVAALWSAAVSMGDETPEESLAPLASGPAKQRIDAFLVPHVASFLDRGMASIRYPQKRDGLFKAFSALYTHRTTALPPWLDGLATDLRRGEDSKSFLSRAFAEEGVHGAAQTFERLKALALALPGWSGMVHWLERHGEEHVELADFLALRLLVERAALRSDPDLPLTKSERFVERPLALLGTALQLGWTGEELRARMALESDILTEELDRVNRHERLRVWHDAFERAHAKFVLGALEARRTAPLTSAARFDLQVVTCIDDREESFRRELEELGGPRIATYGSAGFFGVAMAYASLDDHAPVPQCPAVVTPSHEVHEHVVDEDRSRAERRSRRRQTLATLAERSLTSRTTLQGAMASFFFAVPAMLLLPLRVLFPRLTKGLFQRLGRLAMPEVRTFLAVHHDRDSDEGPASAVIDEGFSVREAIEWVAGGFASAGLGPNLAPLVFFVAHGASSSNNPHRSAYECGACGGHGGGPNARIFARMANDRAVREGLRARGFVVPDDFHVVGAYHDTTNDEVTYFDAELVPAALSRAFTSARELVDRARKRGAHERCRRFASADPNLSFDAALVHTQRRAADLGEARPELGHATNAVCVIGRRTLTRGVFLDRRALLVSYDATQDPSGEVLARVAGAALPVCAGINLEYYFSRVDPDRLGAGTKLPHNVAAHLGVVDGSVGDLRTGLPRQMTELHEAVRLLTILEAPLPIAERVLSENPLLSRLWRGGWVRMVVADPTSGELHAYNAERGAFERFQGGIAPQRAPSSFAYYRGHHEHLPPALIDANGADAYA